jgi:hypothetical protein
VAAASIAPVKEQDQARAIWTIVSAFARDPVERWLFPDLAEYEARFGEFVAAFAGDAFDQSTVWTLGDLRAVALWLAPEGGVDEAAIAAVLTDAVDPERHEDMFSVLGQMDRAHPTFRALVSALAGRASGWAGRGPWWPIARARPRDSRPASPPRLPRDT